MNAAAGTPPMIVVGVDGSEPSKRALRWAADQAQLTGAELEGRDDVGVPADPRLGPAVSVGLRPQRGRPQGAAEAVDSVLHGRPRRGGASSTVTEGHPAFVLTEAARAPSSWWWAAEATGRSPACSSGR